MGTYTKIVYHIVFGTKHRQKILSSEHRTTLNKYFGAILRNKKCVPIEINNHLDHVHILTSIHPTICLSDIVKDLKVASSLFIKKHKLFRGFIGWQEGYGAFTVSLNHSYVLINYIKNQKEHHSNKSYKKELEDSLKEYQIEFNSKYI